MRMSGSVKMSKKSGVSESPIGDSKHWLTAEAQIYEPPAVVINVTSPSLVERSVR